MKCQSPAVENANSQESQTNSRINTLSADSHWRTIVIYLIEAQRVLVGHPRNAWDPYPPSKC